MLINIDCAEALLGAYKDKLDDGKALLCAGPVPTDASEPLDLAGSHTVLAVITANAGATGSGDGLVWDSPSGQVLLKPAGDTWSSGTPAFSGFEDSETTLEASFVLWLPREADETDPPAAGEVRAIFRVGDGFEWVLAGGTTITDGGDPSVCTYARIAQPLGAA